MFGILPRLCTRPSSTSQRRRPRLMVERLETRDCPAAPVIGSLSASPITGTVVQVSGYVQDADTATTQISFSGVMSGTVTANAYGFFSFAAQASALGAVSAVATDAEGLVSSAVQTNVSSQAPSIQMGVTYNARTYVTISGQVFDETPGGMTVTLTGVVSATVTTNSNGQFTWTGQATGLGVVTANTTDAWGLQAAAQQVTLACAAPQITNFGATQIGANTWTFSGHVVDQTAQGLTVQLGGLNGLNGQTAVVDAGGNFSITVQLAPGTNGNASAIVTDWWGLQSNEAEYLVDLG